jgi:hypothetical protein
VSLGTWGEQFPASQTEISGKMHPQLGNWRIGAVIVLSSLLGSATFNGSRAHAQAWLPDRAYTEGPGLRVGDLEVHPGVAVRGGYDSNVFKADGKERTAVIDGQPRDVSQRVRGAGILAVTPHVHLSTLSAQRKAEGEDREGGQRALPPIAFRGGVAATYFHYFVDDGPKNLEIDADLAAQIMPGRPFNMDLAVAYVRSVRPFTQTANSGNAYRYDSVAPRVRANVQSRSGVLSGYVGYAPRLQIYESAVFSYLNSFTHAIETGAGWKFLPSTALVYDGLLDFQNYQKDDPFNTRSPIVFSDNKRFRTRLGINGAVTRALSVRVLAGYSAIVFDDKNDGDILDNHEDVIGEAVLSYGFGPGKLSKVEVGYARDLVSSPLGGWVLLNRGFATLRALIGGSFLFGLEGGIAKVTYGRIWGYDRVAGMAPVPIGSNSELDREDVRVDAALRGEYRVTNWLSFMADASIQTVITDYQYAAFYTGGGSPVPDPAQYFAVLAFAGVRAHY